MEIVVPELVRIKPQALQRLGKYLRTSNCSEIALFWGDGLKQLFNSTVEVSLQSSGITVLHEKNVNTTSIEEIFENSLDVPSATSAIVAIGGGQVIDYCKYISFITKKRLFTVPTIISNDSFCSPVASLYVRNKKRSISTNLPYSVIIDTDILQNAPQKYIFSGMGDLLCKTTAIFDWKLSYKKTGEYVNDFSVVIVRTALDAFINFPDKDLSNPDYIRTIGSSLMMTGIAMEIAGISRPASGSEHLISHAYDKISKSPSLHGIQTGIAAYAVSFVQKETHNEIRKSMESCGFDKFAAENPLNREELITAVRHAPSIKENFYTILSQPGALEEIINFINSDELMRSMTV
ncbi:MAG: iron-containing alcohol dehydrogenase family protein [Spirochaetes bacterium]|nr:iron-containing alcohol dehydrogenase family protein [Spirochaetota bacterium]MBN2770763.1 iron-containing alcohol dehydrogenase family protein [Spirochaetota bacterium]